MNQQVNGYLCSIMKKIRLLLSFYIFAFTPLSAQFNSGFKVIPLGVKGGLDESNLSAYLVAAKGSDRYICLDAGTIYKGLDLAMQHNLFSETNPTVIQQKYINSYFISHAHLDHTAGLIMNATNDLPKNLYGLPSVLEVFKKHYFTWSAWANFGNEGEQPILKKYTYKPLIPGIEVAVDDTDLSITPYLLSHVTPYESTAFLLRHQDKYLLYLGDTGADEVEQSNQLAQLWQKIAPLVLKNQLKAIFIEVSFDNSVPVKSLFGHLTPNLFMKEMSQLNQLTKGGLEQVQLFITHIKPCAGCEITIKEELNKLNQIGLKINYPSQATAIELYD